MPGGPMTVARRILVFDKYSRTMAISCSRPMSDVRDEGKFERGDAVEVCHGASCVLSLGADFQSPRAKRRNAVCSFEGTLNISANRSTIGADGRRSSASNLRRVMVEQPTC